MESTVFPVPDNCNYNTHSSFREDLGQHFWTFLTKPESKPPYEEFKIESDINARFRKDVSGDEESEHMDGHFEDTKLDCSYIGVPDHVAFRQVQPRDMMANEFVYYAEATQGQGLATDYSYIEVPLPQAIASDHTQLPPPQTVPATSQVQDDTEIGIAEHIYMEESSVQYCESTVGDANSYYNYNTEYYDYNTEHFWNSLTKPEQNVATYHQGTHDDDDDEEEEEEAIMDMIIHSDFEGINVDDQETDIENGIDNKYNFKDLASDEENEVQVEDSQIEYCYYNTDQLPQSTIITTTQSSDSDNDKIKYAEFKRVVEGGKWEDIKEFLKNNREAVGKRMFDRERTALHLAIYRGKGWEEIAKCLVKRMTKAELETEDEDGYTPLALAALYYSSLELLNCIVDGNPDVPDLGSLKKIPVIVASWKGFREITRYLYSVTVETTLGPDYMEGQVGVLLLIQCINIKLFGIAEDLVGRFDGILYQKPKDNEILYPIHAFAKTFSALLIGIEHTKSIGQKFSNVGDFIMTCGSIDESREKKASREEIEEDLGHLAKARDFLKLVCDKVSRFGVSTLKEAVYGAMLEAATHGNIEFISKMLEANPELLSATNGFDSIISCAIMQRHENVFNLIYGATDYKDLLLSVKSEYGNILHCAAKLPPPSVLDRISSGGPALQMQREIQWFQAVWGEAKHRYREDPNDGNLTPRALFTLEHTELAEAGEKSMKKTALAATTVAALIVTTMFGAALAVISGLNQKTNFSTLQTKPLFNTFIVLDALSLFSSASSILVFLGILASRYSQQDFLRSLPRMFMIGFYALFCSIVTMMAAFGVSLVVMLDHALHFVIVTIFLLSLFPVMFFFVSLCPVLYGIRRATYGPSIFDKSIQVATTRMKHVDSCY